MIGEAADFRGAPRHNPSTFVETGIALLSFRLALTKLEGLAQLLAAPCGVNDDVVAFTSVGLDLGLLLDAWLIFDRQLGWVTTTPSSFDLLLQRTDLAAKRRDF